MTDDRRVDELDLLAWADGLLDGDPRHRGAVEAALEADPEIKARAQAFRSQTEALQAAYAWRLDDPVPDRLRAAVAQPRAPRRMAGAAAVLSSRWRRARRDWTLGRDEDGGAAGQGRAAALLSERGYAQFVAEQPGRAGPAVAAVGGDRPLDWLADEVSIGLKAPDLSGAGYTLVEKRAVTAGGEHFVRLDYAGPDGASFSLFLAPRREEDGHAIIESRRGGVSMASWLDGPMVSAVVARMPPERTRRLAEAVREAMRAGGEPPAVLQPDPAAPVIVPA